MTRGASWPCLGRGRGVMRGCIKMGRAHYEVAKRGGGLVVGINGCGLFCHGGGGGGGY